MNDQVDLRDSSSVGGGQLLAGVPARLLRLAELQARRDQTSDPDERRAIQREINALIRQKPS
ncbi:hypothetical protein HYW68_02030 [Candidatus Parcubacteria bacterium]|nr:hypothetical protein [Candidatus Parcubacteria bacterium]